MTQKEKAIEQLMLMGICGDFVNSFADKGQVTLFESYIGESVSNYPDVERKIKEIETEYGCLVYAVTYEHFVFGECYSFLIVSKYEEDWRYCLIGIDGSTYSSFAWVWNKTREECSEFGHVVLDADFGGILRIG